MSRFAADLLARARAALGASAPAPAVPVDEAPLEPLLPIPALAVPVAAALCRRFEGFYSKPYLCPAGVPTIGYGATYYLDGRPVKLTDPAISREAAERLLLKTIEREYLPKVLALCPNIRDPDRLAAVIDFAFNLGTGALRASTLRRRVNAEQWADVPAELRKWNKGGGRVLRGLVIRREAEAALI